jgi:ankyrin repeat protein
MNLHQCIIKLGQLLGFPFSDDGICRGVTMRWLEACLAGEEEIFKSRVSKILKNPELFILVIEAIKKDPSPEVLSGLFERFDLNLYDLYAFFNSIRLFQKPQLHAPLFNESLHQGSIEIISKFASSDKIAKRGGLSLLNSKGNVFTESELNAFLFQIKNAIDATDYHPRDSIGFSISLPYHAVGLVYGAMGWKFFDVNRGIQNFSRDDIQGVAYTIAQSINFPKYVAMNLNIVTTAKFQNSDELILNLSSIDSNNEITLELADRRSFFDFNLAILAARNNRVDIIEALIEIGANLDITDSLGCTPLWFAACNGHLKVVETLIRSGVDIHKANNKGITPLEGAASCGFLECVSILKNAGCDINRTDNEGFPSIHYVAKNGHLNVLTYLLSEGVNPNGAAKFGQEITLRELARRGADLNIKNHAGQTLAFIAASHGNTSVINFLLEENADVQTPSSVGITPTIIAVMNHHVDVVAALSKANIKFDLPVLNNALEQCESNNLNMMEKRKSIEILIIVLNNISKNKATFTMLMLERICEVIPDKKVAFNAYISGQKIKSSMRLKLLADRYGVNLDSFEKFKIFFHAKKRKVEKPLDTSFECSTASKHSRVCQANKG